MRLGDRWCGLAVVGVFSIGVAGGLVAACGGGKGGGDVAACNPGWHECAPDGCAPDTSPQSCGSRCTPCPAPASHGTATCLSAACGMACDAGYHPCGSACADDASAATCGAACSPCPAPAVAQAHAACLAGACDFLCDEGYARCGDACCPPPATGLTRLAGGEAHTCAIDAAGELLCWGQNGSGQVGDGSTVERLVPTPVAGAEAAVVRQVAAGFRHALGVDGAGVAYAWGDNWARQVAPTLDLRSAPSMVADLAGVGRVAGGWAHSCALLATGRVACWGNGEAGQLGNGLRSTGAVPVPVPVQGLGGAFALLSGYRFTCALTDVTSMACWGENTSGQLGAPAAGDLALAPVAVANLDGVTALRAVALGMEHACVAYDGPGAAGRVRCWGRGDEGQLGGGATPAVQRTPVEVLAGAAPLEGVVALAAGAGHTCALTEAGGVWCWGAGASGQLGTGRFTSSPTAVAVTGLASGTAGIASGSRHTCALVGTGAAEALRCWGENDHGQLGDGTREPRAVPVAISGF